MWLTVREICRPPLPNRPEPVLRTSPAPGEERFIMGAQMFDAAREMIRASFPPGLSEGEEKRRLCERLYGDVVPKLSGSAIPWSAPLAG